MAQLNTKLDADVTQLKRVYSGQPEDSTPVNRACIDSAEIARTMEMARDAINEVDKWEAAKQREVHQNRTELGLQKCSTFLLPVMLKKNDFKTVFFTFNYCLYCIYSTLKCYQPI